MKTVVLCKIRGREEYHLKVFKTSEGLSRWFYHSNSDIYSRFEFYSEPNFVIINRKYDR